MLCFSSNHKSILPSLDYGSTIIKPTNCKYVHLQKYYKIFVNLSFTANNDIFGYSLTLNTNTTFNNFYHLSAYLSHPYSCHQQSPNDFPFISVNQGRIFSEIVRNTIEKTLNEILDAEAEPVQYREIPAS